MWKFFAKASSYDIYTPSINSKIGKMIFEFINKLELDFWEIVDA